MPCKPLDFACQAASAITEAASEGIWKQFEEWAAKGAAYGVRLAISGWVNVPSPDITSSTSGVAWLTQQLRPITWTVFVLALIGQAGRLALSQRGEDLRRIFLGLAQFVVIAGAGAAIIALLVEIGDVYSVAILDAATTGQSGQNLGERVIAMLGLSKLASPVSGPIAAILFLSVAFSGIAQIILIYVRAVVLILLLGLVPIPAAAAATKMGRQVLRRYVIWALAWTAYKPVAASIYAAGLFMVGNGDLGGFVAGLGVIVMAVFALPALLRLLNPIGATGGGPGAGEVMATGAAVATGAVRVGGELGSLSNSGQGTGGTTRIHDATHGSPTGSPQPAPSEPGHDPRIPASAESPSPVASDSVPPAAAAAAGGPHAAAAQAGAEAAHSTVTIPTRATRGATDQATRGPAQ